MKNVIEITVTKNYVGDWGEYEGVREIIQNGIDGEQEFGCKLNITYTQNGKLVVENVGGSIPKESLLIGFTTKESDDSLIGKFGEGLKLGVLALLRAGNTVKIKNNGEIWTPVIEKSVNFDAEVLKFKITDASKPSKGLRIIIGGIDKSRWNTYKRKFLILRKKTKTMITTSHGDLLIDPKYAGRVFVKGIEVAFYDDLVYGYNFNDADVDRDRKMIDSWDLECKTARILGSLVPQGHKWKRKVYRMLERNTRDVKRMEYAHGDVARLMVKEFVKEHGTEAMPVFNESEAKVIGHHGKRGVQVSESLISVVSSELGTFAEMKQKLCESSFKPLKQKDLTDAERNVYKTAIAMIAKVRPEVLKADIQIGEYKDDNMLGQYLGGKIRISRQVLANLVDTLSTLVHEVCHGAGGDATKSFAAYVERTFAEIAVANMDVNLVISTC